MTVARRTVRNPERPPPSTYIPDRMRQHGYTDAHDRPLVSRGKVPGQDFYCYRGDPADFAWAMPEIELHPPNAYAVLGPFDLDGRDAAPRLNDLIRAGRLPSRSWSITRPVEIDKVGNTTGGGTHAVWCLSTRVYVGAKARPDPIRWYEHVFDYFAELLSADRGYGRVLTHNPASKRWRPHTTWGRASGYTLAELGAYIPNGWRAPPRPVIDDDGSRNCTLFQAAVRFVRQYPDGDLLAYLERHNGDVAADLGKPPLLPNEIAGIARSAPRYASRRGGHRGRLSPADWSGRQAARGRKAGIVSGQARRRETADRDTAIRTARQSGRSLRSIAASYGLSLSGVGRVLSRPNTPLRNANK